jgi:hypothetical protein
LAEFESVLAAAKGKQIVMFLDYDGTLSPIVRDPDSAVMSEEVGQATSFSIRAPEQQGMLCSRRTHARTGLASYLTLFSVARRRCETR